MNQKDSDRERVKEEAARLFLKHGFEKTTTRMIMNSTGVMNSRIYSMFDGKEHLCAESMSSLVDRVSRSPYLTDERFDAIDRILFPVAVHLYATVESEVMYELLTIAHTSNTMIVELCPLVEKYIRSIDPESMPLDGDASEYKAVACMGAVGTGVHIIRNMPEIGLHWILCLTGSMVLNILGRRCDNIESRSERLIEYIEANRDTVLGSLNHSPKD